MREKGQRANLLLWVWLWSVVCFGSLKSEQLMCVVSTVYTVRAVSVCCFLERRLWLLRQPGTGHTSSCERQETGLGRDRALAVDPLSAVVVNVTLCRHCRSTVDSMHVDMTV